MLSNFWEMVPAAVIKSLLGCLIRDLAWDASAISVRVAVLQVPIVRVSFRKMEGGDCVQLCFLLTSSEKLLSDEVNKNSST